MNPKERILKLLEDGKLSAEDAAKLLEALKKSYASQRICLDLGFGHHRPGFFKPGFHKSHLHPGRKKMIVKMVDRCSPNPEAMEFISSGWYA
jgi:hypothetical protein